MYLRNSIIPKLREFKKILPRTFIYELISMKINMSGKIMKTQFFNP